MRSFLSFVLFATLATAQLRITTTGMPQAVQYQPYDASVTATGGTQPYTWSVVASTQVSLPEGMSLNTGTGRVSATQVNGQGGYEVTFRVVDSATPAASVEQPLRIGVHSDPGFGGCQMFPADSIYNQRIDKLPVDTVPSHQIPSGYLRMPIHPDFGVGFYPYPGGIPFVRVPANQPISNVMLEFDGQIQSAGTYSWPFPPWPSALVEGTSYGVEGSDHHILILQSSLNNIDGPQVGPCILYETYSSGDVPGMYDGINTWFTSAGVRYDLNTNAIAASAGTLDTGANDSAGVPIVPLLLRYNEVPLGVQHPLRITFPSPTNWFVWPGTGCCTGTGPPQGLLYRLKASVNWQAACSANLNPQAATVLQALQQYGAYMSDHGGAGYVQGVPDDRWDDDDLACIKKFHLSDLEVVDNSMLAVSDISGQTKPYVAPATLSNGTAGAAYDTAISAVGGNPASRHWLVTSGALPPGLLLDSVAGTISGTTTSSAGSPFNFSITAGDTASGYTSLPQPFSIAVGGSGVQLTVGKTHSGNFTQGQTGAAYTITVGNSGLAPSSGPVVVTENVPAGLSLVSMRGTGWDCSALPSCTRSDALAAGAYYPPIAATVSVASNAASPLVNGVTVSGGGSVSGVAIDPALTFSKCDSNQDGSINVVDVQGILNEALGMAAPAHDLNQDGAFNILDVQVARDSALGLACAAR